MKTGFSTAFRNKALSFVTVFLYLNSLCYALPSDPTVVSGTASVERVDEHTLNITASADSILEYSSFNIGAGETVNFYLPGSDAFSLNRITGGNVTDILGSLYSNGNLILINAFGFNFGASADVQTNGLIASTLNLTNENFLAGNYTFGYDGSGLFSTIINDGLIRTADGGFAVLIAPAIENNGTVSAPLGTVALASGDVVTVGISQDNMVSVAVDEPVSGQVTNSEGEVIANQINNTGTLEANGGRVTLDAQSAGQLFNQAVNMEGHIQANTVEMHDGVVSIRASGHSSVSGDISAGELNLDTPDHSEVQFGDQADINLSGDLNIEDSVTLKAGKSSISLGGDWNSQGIFNPETSTVTFTDAGQVSNVYGNNDFYDFSVLTPSKVIAFESGATQNILGAWTILGSYGNHVRLISTQSGERWNVNPGENYSFNYAWVEDSINLSGREIIMIESTNRGNSIGWDPTGTWTNGSGDMLWSTAANWSGLGGATPGAGDDVLITGAAGTDSNVDAGFSGSVGSINIDNTFSATLRLNRNLTVTTASGRSGNVTSDTASINLNSHTLTIHGNLNLLSTTYTDTNSTTDFAGSGNQTLTPTMGGDSFHNITHSGSGTLSLVNNIKITNNLTISAGTFSLAGQDLDMTGATFSNDGTFQLVGSETITALTQDTNSGTWKFLGNGNSASNTYNIDSYPTTYYNLTIGSIDSADEFRNQGSGITINGGMSVTNGIYTLGASAATTVTGLTTVNGGTYDATGGSVGTQTFNGGLTVSSGSFLAGSITVDINGALTISGTSTFTAPSGNLQVADDVSISGSPTFSANSGTVIFDSATKSQTFTTGGVTLNNLTMNNSTLPGAVTISGNLDVNGNLTLTAGNFALSVNDPNVNVAGNMSIADGVQFGISGYTGTFTFDGSGTSTLTDNSSAGISFGNITVDGSSKTLEFAGSSPTRTFSTLTIGSDDTVSLNSESVSISTLSNNGTFKLIGSETVTLAANDTDSGTWLYVGDADGTGDVAYTLKDFGGTDYYNLIINMTDADDKTLSTNPLTVAGAFTLSNGNSSAAFASGGNAVTIAGLTTISGGDYYVDTSGGAQTFNGGLTISGGSFTGNTGTNIDVNGIFTLSSGTFSAPDAGADFTVSDDFLVTGGTFTHNNGKVTLDSTTTATIDAPAGGLTFNDLEIASTAGKTVQFTGGDTFTVADANTFTVGNNATLTSTNATDWNLSVNNAGGSTAGVSFGTGVSVARSNNTSANTISTSGVTDGGNNTRWTFSGGGGGGGGGSSSPSSGGTSSGSGDIDSGINSGLGGGGTQNSGGENNTGNSGNGGGDGGNEPGGGDSGGNGGGGGGGDPQQSGGQGNFDFYFEESKRTKTKVTVFEGSVYVVDKNNRMRILKKDESATVGDSSPEEFKEAFYVNYRTPEKFRSTVRGEAYTVYLDKERKSAIFFITKETGSVTFKSGAKPQLKTDELPKEKSDAK